MFAYLTKLRTLIALIVLVYLHGCALDPYAKNETNPVFNDPNPVVTYPTEPGQPYTPVPSTNPVIVDTPITTTPNTPPNYNMTTYHYVQAGENLYRIGLTYGVTTNDLLRWNPGINPTDLRVGQRLAVSGPSAPVSSPNMTYPVKTPPAPDFGYNNPPPAQTPNYGYNNPPPAQTPNYGYNNPPPTTPIGTSYHIVKAGETLYRISKMYGVTVQQLQAWNAGISPSSLVIGQRLIVSDGNVLPTPTVSPPMNAAPINATPLYHVVQRGDTLYNISRRYNMDVKQLASLNGLYPPYPPLSLGQRLTISSNTTTAPTTPRTTAQYHIVQAGENLYRIALKYGYTLEQVAGWNNLYPPYNLSVGQRLALSANAGLASQSNYYNPPPATDTTYSLLSNSRVTAPTIPLAVKSPSYHIVENNETLSSIAKKYDVTTHELAIWNGIGTPYTVFPGQKLLIP